MRNAALHIEELKEEFGNKDSFQIADLSAFYESFNPKVAKSTVNLRIYSLVNENAIQRIGRGTYKYGAGDIFTHQISPKAFKINNLMKNNFPYLKYLIWHISEINFLSHHLINKDIYYVEVERDAVDSVFEQLRDKYKYVLRGKSNEDVYSWRRCYNCKIIDYWFAHSGRKKCANNYHRKIVGGTIFR